MSKEQFSVGKRIDEAAQRSGLDREFVVGRIEKTILAEAKKYFRGRELEVQLNSLDGHISLFQSLRVVQGATTSMNEIPFNDVRKESLNAQVGDELLFRLFYRDADESRAREQMKQFSSTPALQFKKNNFDRIVLKTTEALLKTIKPQAQSKSKSSAATGVGKRVRRGAIFVDPLRRKRKIPLPKEIEILNRAARTYKPGSTICREGEQSSELLLMMTGKMEVYQNDAKVNTIEGETKFIGLLSYFTKGLRTATLKAETKSKVVHIPETNIAQLFSQAPTLALRMLQDLSDLFLKRENELKQAQGMTPAGEINKALANNFWILALSCVANSDPELRSKAFNRIHRDLVDLNLVKSTFIFEDETFEHESLNDEERAYLRDLSQNAKDNKKSASVQNDERAKLLNQMSFTF